MEQVKEGTRDAWGIRLLHSTAQDVIYAFRVLRKRPGFAMAVVASLALGICPDTPIFTLMDAVMWRMVPVKNPPTVVVRTAGPQSNSHRLHLARVPTATRPQHLGETGGLRHRPNQRRIDGPPEPSLQEPACYWQLASDCWASNQCWAGPSAPTMSMYRTGFRW